jgi:hypothetical protein
MLFSGELNIGDCGAVLPVEEKERVGIFYEVFLYKQVLLKSFYLDRSSTVLPCKVQWTSLNMNVSFKNCLSY